jgi:hypothetical protein
MVQKRDGLQYGIRSYSAGSRKLMSIAVSSSRRNREKEHAAFARLRPDRDAPTVSRDDAFADG